VGGMRIAYLLYIRQYEIIVLFTKLVVFIELIARIYIGEKQAHAM